MIVVTGSMRTGTSLVMQTLLKLGLKSPAPPFVDEAETPRALNPKGYYDLALSDVVSGIHHDRFRGMAVKLFPGQLCLTPKERVAKVIVCRRKDGPRDRSAQVFLQAQTCVPSLRRVTVKQAREIHDANMVLWDKMKDDYDHTEVWYDLITDGEHRDAEVQRIADYVGKTDGVEAALANVDVRR